MRTKEDIETVIKMIGEYFESPGINQCTHPDIMQTNRDAKVITETLEWVLGGGSRQFSKMVDGLIEIDRKNPESQHSE